MLSKSNKNYCIRRIYMIFGVKEKRAALGQFTSEKCSSCKKGNKYIFFRITKFIVILFIKLIPISNRYESECVGCEDIIKIDKKAGKKLAKQKFGVENSNQNFLITVKLLFAAVIIAAAVLLPLYLIAPPMSPDMIKTLVDEPGIYTISDEEDRTLAIVQVTDDQKVLKFYNDISDYTTPDGKDFELHKYYEEKFTQNGSYMAAIIDNFAALKDDNGVFAQRYYYDIAKGTYGFSIGVTDISTIEYSDNKTIYPIDIYVSDTQTLKSKVVIYDEADWRIDVRLEVTEDGTESIVDMQFKEKQDGRVVKETSYLTQANDGSEVDTSGLTSANTAQEYYNFIKNNDLKISYVSNYTYYKNTNIIVNAITTTYDEYGNTSDTVENVDVVQKYNYYITTKAN